MTRCLSWLLYILVDVIWAKKKKKKKLKKSKNGPRDLLVGPPLIKNDKIPLLASQNSRGVVRGEKKKKKKLKESKHGHRDLLEAMERF